MVGTAKKNDRLTWCLLWFGVCRVRPLYFAIWIAWKLDLNIRRFVIFVLTYGLIFVHVGLRQSLEVAQCHNLPKIKNLSCCNNTSSGQISLANGGRSVHKYFEATSRWCNSDVPGSSLIIIERPESQAIVESFIAIPELANETIIIDALKLSARNNPSLNGQPKLSTGMCCEFRLPSVTMK